ncbi:bifunctional diguanylate cyclase/phosphodiesterase [Merismopedia glauca]|uniref:Diguanylate cyclase n=1 Tax=Merismopedia glauca CCAP 1448/3 TaxID=1296344 RepID=A0A2T1C8Q7_9CYAN|nr:EAL domain-containing protein [Merismopedia glauca]PSB04650.1 hypothetical protein C7B64_02915 [Merismopedia glauca CCAP 1448/3]
MLLSQPQISTEAIALAQLIASMTEATSESEIYTTFVDLLPQILPIERVSVNLLNSSRQDLEIVALQGIEAQMPRGTKIPSDRLVSARTLETRQTQIEITDPQSSFVDSAKLAETGIQKLISTPLIVHKQAIGTIDVGVCLPDTDTQKITPIILQVVGLMATQLEKSFKIEQAQATVDRYRLYSEQLQILNDIAYKLSSLMSEGEIFDLLAQAMVDNFPLQRVSYAKLEPDGKFIRVFKQVGDNTILTNALLPVVHSIFAWVVEHNQPLISSDLDRSIYNAHQILAASGFKASWSVPVLVGGEVIGVLNAATTQSQVNIDELRDCLLTLGRLMGATIERIQMQEQAAGVLRANEARMLALVDDSPLLLIVVNVDREIVRVSRFGASQLGYQPENLVGLPFSSLHPESDRPSIKSYLDQLLEIEGGEISHQEVNMSRCDGKRIWARQTARKIYNPQGEPEILFVCEDITELRSLTAKLEHQAHYDNLTQLPNRTRFNQALVDTIFLAQDANQEVALLFIDLDRFKSVNDILGHLVGDRLLNSVAQRFTQTLRSSDLVARLGGDEFVVILPQVKTIEGVAIVAQKLISQLEPSFTISDREISIGCSIGIALFPRDGQTPSNLMKNADIAMYEAKKQGGNSYFFYQNTLSEQISTRLTLENYLKDAIANQELYLVFQPQVNIITGQVEGLEALLRWEHPILGNITPATFIPIAEENHLIEELTNWVLQQSLQVLKKLHQHYHHLCMAVNVSARGFTASDPLDRRISHLLTEYELSGCYLALEVTERFFMENTARSAEMMANLRKQGIRIAIDDFGTGFSSLTYLADLPIDTLKIDRSFTKDLDTDSRKKGIMSGIVAIARSLKIQCIAEGVESQTQLIQLSSLGCHQYQGFLFSKPVKVEHLPAILEPDYRQLRGTEAGEHGSRKDRYSSEL